MAIRHLHLSIFYELDAFVAKDNGCSQRLVNPSLSLTSFDIQYSANEQCQSVTEPIPIHT